MVSKVFWATFLLFIPPILADIVDFHLLGAIPDDISGILIVMKMMIVMKTMMMTMIVMTMSMACQHNPASHIPTR